MASAPACKSDLPFNFGPASTLDSIVHGSARPGALSQRCFNPEDKVTEAEVKEWAEFIKEHGVKRVVGLLADDEIATYHRPPAETLREEGLHVVNVPLKKASPEAVQTIIHELEEAKEAGEKVVVHCWGGGGRTGKVLALWLAQQHKLALSDAAAEVEGTASFQGASRRVNLTELKELVDVLPATSS